MVFWSHIATHLRPADEIRVFPDDMAWELVLHVVDAGQSWANVQTKHFHEYLTRARFAESGIAVCVPLRRHDQQTPGTSGRNLAQRRL